MPDYEQKTNSGEKFIEIIRNEEKVVLDIIK